MCLGPCRMERVIHRIYCVCLSNSRWFGFWNHCWLSPAIPMVGHSFWSGWLNKLFANSWTLSASIVFDILANYLYLNSWISKDMYMCIPRCSMYIYGIFTNIYPLKKQPFIWCLDVGKYIPFPHGIFWASLEVFRVLDDGLLDRHPLALCSTGGTADENENGDASTARWPPVECPRDFVTWRPAGGKHKEGPEKTS